MIVRDEERVLRRALNSVKGLADEIVVVDTGSKDNTVAIAREMGAKTSYFGMVQKGPIGGNRYSRGTYPSSGCWRGAQVDRVVG